MKRICVLVLVWLLLSTMESAAAPRVVATINIIADMAQHVAGNKLEITALLPAGTDPHTYEPTPKDAATIAHADLILVNGLTLEGWLQKLITSAATAAEVSIVTDRIDPIKAAEFHNAYDPHAWMSLANARLYVLSIDSVLSRKYPEFSQEFHANAAAYLSDIQRTEQQVLQLISRIPTDRRFLITSHDAFQYFARAYGFKVTSILGTSTDADVSLADMNHLIGMVQSNQIPAIFVEVAINPKILNQIATDLHIRIGGKLFTDSFGPPGTPGDNYLAMILFNVQTITKALAAAPVSVATTGNENIPYGLIISVLIAFAVSFSWVWFRIYPSYETVANWNAYSLEINNLSVMVDRKMILSNIFLSLKPGRLYGLLGANGSGKSTLVKTIVGLYKPLSGEVLLHGKPIREFLRQVAYLPQKEEFDMNFPVTVEDVVKLGFFPNQHGMGEMSSLEKVQLEQVLQQLEIFHLKDRQIGQLSGGQFQRTLLARALCQKAEVFILDEPFVGVDHATEEIIINLLKSLAANGKLVIIVHHDLTKVRSYFDHLVMINQRIIASGPVEEVFTEANIQSTYSGKVTLLQQALQLIQ